MSNQTFSNGRGYVTLNPYRTSPEERIRVSISDNFVTGAEGLRRLAAYLCDQALALEDDAPSEGTAPQKPARRKNTKAAASTKED